VAMRSFTNLGLIAVIPLIASGIAAAQSSQSQSKYEERTVEINGHTGKAMVFVIDGKSYIAIESLARIANGSLTFRGGNIVLHLPAADAASAHHEQHPLPGMTNDFMRASLQALATLKEWTHALAHDITTNPPANPGGTTMAGFRKRAADQLRVATVDAKNESDEDALRLLRNHFNQVDNWNQKLIGEQRRMDMAKYSMFPNALDRDPSYQGIMRCAGFLATMLPSGQFEENIACR
jgi:hypothetical protein